MITAPLAEVASINPRGEKIAADEVISFVGMAQLDAEKATAVPLGPRPFGEVSKGYTVFRDGDVLAAKITPCWENGKVGQAKLGRPIGVGSTEFHVVRPGPSLIDRYLLHYLRQPHVRVAGELRMTGSGGQRRVPKSFFEELQIPLPSPGEQRRIAAILDHVDDLRTKRRRVLAHLDSLGQAIFHDMFGHETHDMVRLEEVAAVSSGITKGRRTTESVEPVPYLAVANVQAGYLNLDVVKEIPATAAEIERYALRDGDLVLTEGGDPDKLGRGTVWRGQLPLCIHQNHIFRVRPNEQHVLPDYLSAALAGIEARAYFLRSAKQTTGIASINMTQLRATPVSVPPIEHQRAFLERLAALEQRRADLGRLVAAHDELFMSLQSRAFRGEL